MSDRTFYQDSARGTVSQTPDPRSDRYGSKSWAVTPSGTRGVLNDTLSIHFADATLASAFVARWCVRAKVEMTGGVFQVREDEPEPWVGAGLHRTP